MTRAPLLRRPLLPPPTTASPKWTRTGGAEAEEPSPPELLLARSWRLERWARAADGSELTASSRSAPSLAGGGRATNRGCEERVT
eukprot:768807-Hanusia_phi.AAC.2